MKLGAFSVSLTGKNPKTSKAFYEKFGFTVFGGDDTQNWLILTNGDTTIGLFQEMFENNMLTFNRGWSQSANALSELTDVRDLQRQLKADGVKLMSEADELSTGPASLIAVDPDESPILVGQHV